MATYNGTNGDDVINAAAGSNTINAGNGTNKITAVSSGNQNVNAGTGNDTITTGDGNDTINAGDGVNVINAGNGTNNVTTGSGNDTITSGSGNDTINAGNGRNIINAGDGRNTVTTGTGDDEIRAGSGDDQIYAGEGNNWIDAGAGNNTVTAGAGNDTITTGSGNDNISAGNGNNVINAGGGNNSISAGSGDDWIRTAAGNDTISAGDGRNDIDAGDGNNIVNTGRGDDTIVTGRGNDQINAGDGRNVIDAGDGDNRVNTGSGADDITTGDGDDRINAGEGVNVIRAGDGDNDITSGASSDTITAGSGNDEIHAGEGHNVIDAGNGHNEVTAGAGNDTITTGSGNDAIYAGEGNNVINAGNGNNAVYAGSGNDQITTGSGNDAIYAGEGNNVIDAGDGVNVIYSGSGSDRIITGSGSDIIYSGNGDDFVDAGGGSDAVYLDGGNDTYRYVMSQHSNTIDVAWGGSGTDTLQLVLTADQARNARVVSDIQRFNTDSDGNGLWGWIFGFQFTAFNLSVRDFENIDVIAPVDAFDDAATVGEDSQVAINVLANDQDLGEANNSQLRVISYDAAGVPGTLTLANNQFTFVPGAAYQYLAAGQSTTVSFTYTIGDNEGYTDTATVTLTIVGSNDGPVAIADVAAITENQAVAVDVLANDTDVDANHVFTLVSAGAPSGKGLATVVNNKLVFTPGTAFDHLAAGVTETVVVTYTMKDDQGATSTSTLTVTVTGTNDGPVAVTDTAAGTENQTLTINVLANDTDVDDGSVFTLTGATAPAGKGAATVVNNQLVFTPGAAFDHLAAGVTETVVLTYAMKDQFGAVSNSTVTVTVTGTNDGPCAVADTAAGTENQTLTINVLANDSDVDDGAVLTLTSAAAPAGKGTASVVNNQLVFNPGTAFDHLAAGVTETVVLTYAIKDDKGAASTATVTLTITGTNDGPVAVADSAAGTENQTLTVNVLANDTDLDDGAVFTLTGATAPAGKGTATVVNNELVFTPGTAFDHLALGATETVIVNYAMQDQFGAVSTATLTLTVTGTNDGPVVLADSAAGTENQTLTVDVLANDTDVDDGAVLTLTSATAPAGKGVATVVGNQLVFTPGTDFDHLALGVTETVVVSYAMQDDQGAESVSTVTITVTGTNDAPIAVADTAATTENAAITVNVLANDTDLDDGHVFTLTAAAAPAGKGVASVADNQLVFTPGTDFDHLAAGAVEIVTLTYAMTDENGAASSSTVTVTITGTNDAPVAVADVAAGTENQVLTIDVLANDTDVDDGAVFTLVSAAAPSGRGVATVAGNQLVFTPGTDFDHLAAGATETIIVSYTMTDEHGAVSTPAATITVTGTNDAPIAVADVAATTENAAITVDVLANDTDLDDGHVFTLLSATTPLGSAAVVANQLVFNPGTDFDHLALGATATVAVTYTMADDQGAESVSTVTITVTGTNDGPVAVADAVAGTENQVLTIDVLANDTDLDDGAVFTLTGAAAPAGKGAATVVNNQLVFTPGADFDHLALGAVEVITLTYTMTDENGAASASTVTVTITGTNDAPVAVADLAATTENAAITIDVLANDTDVDDAHVFTLVGASTPLGSAAVVGNQLVFNPGTDFDHLALGVTQNVVVSYLMGDENGATSAATVTITVTGTNDTPVAVADMAAGTENQILTINVLANDTDVDDGHVFTLTTAGAPAGKGLAAVVGNQLVFAPGTDFDHLALGVTEQVTLTYTMRDENGATSSSTVTVTVTGTNDAPVAGFDFAATTENASIAIDVLANDTDLDDGAVLTVIGAAMTNPSQGSVAVVNNQLIYTPANFDHLAAGATASVTIFYAIMDQNGGQSAALVSVTVTGTNDGPVAVADTAATTENAAITVDVLANDTDIDDGHVFTLTAAAAPVGKGVATVVNNQLAFAPGTDFDHLALGATEVVTVSYTMTDEYGAASTATLTVTVTGTNDAPVAVADVAATTENTAITVDVLANDTDIDDGHVFTLTAATAPAGKGAASIVGNQLVFTPGTDFDHLALGATEVVTVSYAMQDENGAPSTSTLTITVTGTNDAPIAVADTAAITENQTLTLNVLANDTDLDDGAVFTLTAVEAPAGKGSVSVVNNQLVFNPGTAFDHLRVGAVEQVELTYTMRDEHGATSTSTVMVTITGTNDAPVAVADVAAVIEDTVITGTVAANDSDVDDFSSRTFALNAPVAGLTLNADGTYSFDASDAAYQNLAQGATRVVTAFYTVTDNNGLTAATSLTITVTGTNDAPIAIADTGTVLEDSTLSGNLRTNDIDVDTGAVLTYTLNAPVAGLTLNSNGTYSFAASNAAYQALALNEVQVVTAGYTVTDQFGATSQSTLTITITGRNDTPVAVADTATAIEDGAIVTGNLGTNDSDVDHGAVLTYSTVTGVAGLTINANGTYSFDPSNAAYQNLGAGATRVVTATYRVTDQNGASATSTLNVTVTGTNDAPVVGNVTLLANRLGNGGFDATPNFTGWTINTSSTGTSSVYTSTATIDRTGTVIPGDNAVAVLNYDATTSSYGTGYGPSIKSNAFAGNAGDTVSFTYKLSAGSDQAVGRAYIRDATTGAIVQTIFNYQVPFVGSTGVQTVNVVLATSGSYTIDFQVGSYDATGGTAIGARLDIGFAGILANGISEDAAFTFANGRSLLLANSTDIDVGDVLTVAPFTATSMMGATVTLAADGTLVVDPRGSLQIQALKQGESATDSFTFTVSDGKGGFTTGTANVTVTGANDGPVANADTASTSENQAVTVNALGNDTDVDHGAVLTLVSAGVTPGKGSVAVVANQIVFTPGAAFDHLAAGASETVVVTYVMKDEYGATSTSTATITVLGTNDAPVAVADFAAGTENQTLTVDVLANDTDLDDGHAFALIAAAAPSGKGTASVQGNQLVFAPGTDFDHLAAGATETVTLTYTMSDEQGAPATSTVTITVTGTNDAPVAVADSNAVNEDATVSGSVAANDSDVDDGATLTYSLDAPVDGLTFNANGSYSFDAGDAAYQALALGETRIVTANYTVTDDKGATATATLSIAVTGTNDAPTAVADTAMAYEDSTFVTGSVAANDSDPDHGWLLSYSLLAPVAGLTFNADGSYAFDTFDPAYNALGQGEQQLVVATYRATDEHGASSIATLTITVTGTNDAPVAVADTASAIEDGLVVTGSLAGNDSDVDNGTTLRYFLTSPILGLTLDQDGSYSFDPSNSAYQALAMGETENVVASYVVMDQFGAQSTSTLTITLTGVNDAPVVTSDAVAALGEVTEAGAVNNGGTASASGALTASDVDHGSTTAWSGNAAGVYGSFAINAAGAWTYTLDNDAAATQALDEGQVVYESFTATVTDEHGATATQTVIVQVTGAVDNLAPTADAIAVTTGENAVVAGVFTGDDADADDDGATIGFQLVSQPVAGTVTANGKNFSFNPGTDFDDLAAGETRDVTFTYTATDSHGAVSAPATVTVTVTGTNDAPVITSSTLLGTVVEAGNLDDGTVVAGTPSATGTFTATDVDHNATATWSVVGSSAGTYGNLSVNAAGAWTYTLDNSKAATQALAEGQFGGESFTVRVTDDKGAFVNQTVTLTVTGTNDAPVAVADTYAGGTGAAVALTGEILVNTQTSSQQYQSALTALSNGTFVVTWADAAGDGSGYGVKAQLFAASGAKIGGEFLVNTQPNSTQFQPQIGALADGGFVVTWSDASTVGDLSPYGIKAQLYSASGVKVGTEFLVNTVTGNSQTESSVTGLSNGGFLVTWTDASATGTDTSSTGVKAQLFSATGAKVGGEFLVNTQTNSAQNQSTVTALASGGFVVTWTDNSLVGGDASGSGIKAQIYNASGVKVGGEFLVNTLTNSTQQQPTITALASGGFAVAWADASTQGGDASGYGIRAAIYNASGVKQGVDIQVNTQTTSTQYQPSITSVAGGGFMVTWSDASQAGGDVSGYGIKAQLFSATGVKIGGEFLVNTATANTQDDSAVTFVNGGTVAVVWTDASLQGGDASVSGIKLRLYTVESALTENTTATVDVLANDTDVDAGKVLTLTGVSAPAGHGVASIVGNKLVFTPGSDFDHLAQGATEQVVVQYTVTDDKGATATSTATLTITGTNDLPVITSGASAATGAVAEDGVALATGQLTSSDVDDGATATWSMVSSSTGTYGSLAINAAGQWTYTLNNASAATQALDGGETVVDSFTVKVTDDKGGVTNQVVAINVAGANDAPTVSGGVSLPGNFTLVANRLTNGDFSATPNLTGWTVSTASTGTSSVSTSTVTIDRGGTLISGDSAVAWLRYDATVPVGYGTGQGPSITSAAFQGNQGDTIRFVYVLASSTDQAIGTGYIRDAATGAIVQTIFNYQVPVIGSTGTQTVELTLAQSGNYTIDFRVGSYDATGGQAIGANLYIGTAQITSTGISENAAYTNTNGKALLLANVTDADGDTLVIAPFTTTTANGVAVTYLANGTLTIDPTLAPLAQALSDGEKLTDSFTYTVSDGHGGSVVASANYTLVGVNDAPVAVADTATTGQSQSVTVNVLANDYDVDHSSVMTLSAVSAPAGKGSVSIVNNQLVFNPGSAFAGLGAGQSEDVVVSYTVKDQFNLTSTSTATIHVTGPAAAGFAASGETGDHLSALFMLDGDGSSDAGTGEPVRIEATAAAETLHATAGDNVFVFHAGTAAGDHILDFQGAASEGGDKIEFTGFSADAVFTQIDETHWQIDYNAGTQHEVIVFDNAAPINTQDFTFV